MTQPDDRNDAVRSPELRRGGWRLMRHAALRAGRWIPIGLTASIVWVVAKIITPLAAAAAIDEGYDPYDAGVIVKWCVVIVVLSVIAAVCAGFRWYCAFYCGHTAEHVLRSQLFSHLQQLHFGYHDRTQIGNLMVPLIEADPRWYEQLDPAAWPELAWRDPWVFQDPDSGTFHAMVTARAREGDPATRGVIGHASSIDLLTWTVGPPVTRPGVFGHLEIPQVERVGGGWRLLFSTPPGGGHAVEGTHLLSAAGPLGPYEWSTHQLLDADLVGTRYGGRLVRVGGGWQLLAWLNRGPDGGFVGELADPVLVHTTDGRVLRAAAG